MKYTKMSELRPRQTIRAASGTYYIVLDNADGVLTLLRLVDDRVFGIDLVNPAMKIANHLVEVISSPHSERSKVTIPDNFNEFLALIGA
jgi:hypothetical protein